MKRLSLCKGKKFANKFPCDISFLGLQYFPVLRLMSPYMSMMNLTSANENLFCILKIKIFLLFYILKLHMHFLVLVLFKLYYYYSVCLFQFINLASFNPFGTSILYLNFIRLAPLLFKQLTLHICLRKCFNLISQKLCFFFTGAKHKY